MDSFLTLVKNKIKNKTGNRTGNKAEDKNNILIKQNEPMKAHTSLRVGGPADFFVVSNTLEDLVFLYGCARELNIPVFILGSGTNILVGDKGIRGLIIKNNVSRIEVLDKISFNFKKKGSSRRQETHWKEGFLSSQDLCYEEDINEGVLVEVTSGTPLSFLINQTLKEGITGLQWFSGIPGTVGGAVWNNIHGADLFFGDFLYEVTFIDKDLTQKKLLRKDLDFSYNKTCFQDNSKIILSVKLLLPLGNKVKALNVAKEWIKRKSVQPKNSAGCTFSNLTKEKAKRLNLEN
ncbi:MAG: FAD-binding protein, partial [bacterium]